MQQRQTLIDLFLGVIAIRLEDGRRQVPQHHAALPLKDGDALEPPVDDEGAQDAGLFRRGVGPPGVRPVSARFGVAREGVQVATDFSNAPRIELVPLSLTRTPLRNQSGINEPTKVMGQSRAGYPQGGRERGCIHAPPAGDRAADAQP